MTSTDVPPTAAEPPASEQERARTPPYAILGYALLDLDLTGAEFKLLTVLQRYGVQDRRVWATVPTLATAAKLSRNTVKTSIQRLAAKGLIRVEPTPERPSGRTIRLAWMFDPALHPQRDEAGNVGPSRIDRGGVKKKHVEGFKIDPENYEFRNQKGENSSSSTTRATSVFSPGESEEPGARPNLQADRDRGAEGSAAAAQSGPAEGSAAAPKVAPAARRYYSTPAEVQEVYALAGVLYPEPHQKNFPGAVAGMVRAGRYPADRMVRALEARSGLEDPAKTLKPILNEAARLQAQEEAEAAEDSPRLWEGYCRAEVAVQDAERRAGDGDTQAQLRAKRDEAHRAWLACVRSMPWWSPELVKTKRAEVIAWATAEAEKEMARRAAAQAVAPGPEAAAPAPVAAPVAAPAALTMTGRPGRAGRYDVPLPPERPVDPEWTAKLAAEFDRREAEIAARAAATPRSARLQETLTRLTGTSPPEPPATPRPAARLPEVAPDPERSRLLDLQVQAMVADRKSVLAAEMIEGCRRIVAAEPSDEKYQQRLREREAAAPALEAAAAEVRARYAEAAEQWAAAHPDGSGSVAGLSLAQCEFLSGLDEAQRRAFDDLDEQAQQAQLRPFAELFYAEVAERHRGSLTLMAERLAERQSPAAAPTSIDPSLPAVFRSAG